MASLRTRAGSGASSVRPRLGDWILFPTLRIEQAGPYLVTGVLPAIGGLRLWCPSTHRRARCAFADLATARPLAGAFA